MHILEQYAINCGVKIDKPYILEKFFPLPFDKFITFHAVTKFPSRHYDYFQEVIDLIHPYLQEKGIHIVQVGSKDEPSFEKTQRTNGMTNFNQLAYIIGKTMLHFGVDSFPIHLASAYDKKIIALYSNVYKQNSKPYWGDTKKQTLIETHRNGKKPSYSVAENPKTINLIKPEEIAKSILSSLGIKHEINIDCIFLGRTYGGQKKFNLIPNHLVQNNSVIETVNVRMDLVHDEDMLKNQLRIMPCSITTNKSIDCDILKTFKGNIIGINIMLEDENELDFIKNIKSLNIKYGLYSFLNEEALNKIKLKYMDYGLITALRFDTEKIIKIINDNKSKKIFYKTNEFYLSNGNVYLSEYDFLFDKNAQKNLKQNYAEFHSENILKENPDKYILFTIDN